MCMCVCLRTRQVISTGYFKKWIALSQSYLFFLNSCQYVFADTGKRQVDLNFALLQISLFCSKVSFSLTKNKFSAINEKTTEASSITVIATI